MMTWQRTLEGPTNRHSNHRLLESFRHSTPRQAPQARSLWHQRKPSSVDQKLPYKSFHESRHRRSSFFRGKGSLRRPSSPQGTILDPLLFLCHINDLTSSVISQVRLFADDCLLYRPIQTL